MNQPRRNLTRPQALRLVEGAYLAATTGLIWLALYYLPVGGALFRLALPLPLSLLQLRRGGRSGAEGVLLAVLLMTALMGPVRGPLLLFPYGLMALWLGWSWGKGRSWWLSWPVGSCSGQHWISGAGAGVVAPGGRKPLGGDHPSWCRLARAVDRAVAVTHQPRSHQRAVDGPWPCCGAGGDLCAVTPRAGVLDFPPPQRANPRATKAPARTCCP